LAGKLRIVMAGLGLLVMVGLVAGCGSSGSSSTTADAPLQGGLVKPPSPVPALKLDNSLGQPVNIADYRGKAVLVTFIYDHCPDICPLIVGNLHAAQDQMSGAERQQLQIIAVSVDPKGDTPKTVKAFLADHQMTGRMQYLIGSRPQLERTWSDWHIVAKNSPKKGNPDAVEHSALIYGITGNGELKAVYPANFKPKEIVHDVPILASS
jgi:protein SCO1